MTLNSTASGVLLLDKPAGVSSAKALAMAKKKLGLKKAGHCGTLDPMATGLLVLLAGSATRINNYVQAGNKLYSGIIRLGVVTDSDDICGTIIKTCAARPAPEAVLETAASFVGKIQQVPPQVSALKVQGERSYERARRGEVTELAAREVEIFSFSLRPAGEAEWSFSVQCSKGTYIRSLARDLGAKLGCGACLAALRREVSEPFSLQQARTIEDIGPGDLRPWTEALPHLPAVNLPGAAIARLGAGDQSVLSAISQTASWEKPNLSGALQDRPKGGPELAIFKDAATGRACGLLVNEDGVWKLACNLCPILTSDSQAALTSEQPPLMEQDQD